MKIINTLLSLLVLCLLSATAFAQPGSNDFSFNTIDDGTFGDHTGFDDGVLSTSIQADGKIIVAGGFSSYNGTTRNYIARLNEDGSLDNTFSTGEFNNWIRATSIQTDGKVILGGSFVNYNGSPLRNLARLNTDGSLDDTFNTGTGFLGGAVEAISIQADGKIIVGGNFTSFNGTSRNRIIRLNADGSVDLTFDPGSGFEQMVNSISIQADGKIIVGGAFNIYNGFGRNKIVRLNADGSLDTSFVIGTGFNSTVISTSIQADGKIIVAGGYSSFNGTTRSRIARLNADGSLDATFNPGTGFNDTVRTTSIQPDGKIIAGGGFTSFNGTGILRIARLNDDGSLDATFITGNGFGDDVRTISIQPDGNIIVGGLFSIYNSIARNKIARINSNGSLDSTFSPITGSNATIQAISLQSDGKIIVGGSFTNINGTLVMRIARLNSDGSIDPTFNTGTGFNNIVYSIVVQPNGKIIVGGQFTMFNGTQRRYMARLNANGSLDTTFDPVNQIPTTVRTISVEVDGTYIIGGDFGEGIKRISEIGNDTTLGSSDGFDAPVYTTALQSDEKIIVGGNFSSYDGSSSTWHRIVRLNSSGSLDLSFNLPGTGANDLVRAVGIQSNQKIIVGGDFTVFNDEPLNRIVRVNSNGSIDATFNSGTGFDGSVYSISIQADGKILVGGSFTSYNGTSVRSIVRLNSNGSLDTTFDSGDGFNGPVYATKIQSDGKIIAAGEYSQYDGVWRNRIARILNCSPLVNTVSVSGNTLTSNATGVDYQWINCNNNTPVPNQTNQTFTPSASGNYAVIVSENGCEETSDCVSVIVSGVDEIINSSIDIYPNPSSDAVTITSSSNIEKIELMNTLGQVVQVFESLHINKYSFPLPTESGTYFVKIYTEKGTINRRVVRGE